MLHKVKKACGMLKSSSASLADIFERDPQVVKFDGEVECHTNGANMYGTFDETIEAIELKQLSKHVKEALRHAREKDLKCELLIPCGLIAKISHDILRMSQNEPCGIRGCVLYINLEEKDRCRQLIKLPLDPNTVSTFELYLTLKEDVRSWCYIKKFLLTVSGCFQETTWNSSWKILCSGFLLVKKKLYRMDS